MATTKSTYALPVDMNDVYLVKSDPRAHFGPFKHGIDFVLPEGSTICAPKSGTVVDLQRNSRQGGFDPKYAADKYCNYLTIKHKEGEYSQYLHLKHKGVLVKLKQKVKEGQIIALSGNTGLSTAPHLHFQVFKLTKTPAGFETLRVLFKRRIKIDRTQPPIPKSMKKMIKLLEKVKKRM
jgi:murein DD-endopeptidase MepM/ murein hydrolase activator NlpD